MVEDRGGGQRGIDKQSWAEDQAKAQDDEKLDEEHESVSEGQEKLEEVCIPIWNWINTSTSSMIHSFNL